MGLCGWVRVGACVGACVHACERGRVWPVGALVNVTSHLYGHECQRAGVRKSTRVSDITEIGP